MDSLDPDFLKPIDQVFHADFRNTLNFPSEEAAFREHYRMISSIALDAAVHNDIKVQFETAKNVFLYSFYAYRLGMVGLKQAFAALELGLRRYVGEPEEQEGKRRPHNGLTVLLERAHARGMYDVSLIKPHLKFENFIKLIKNFRNQLAHGTHILLPPHLAISIVQDCATVLNQVCNHIKANNLRQIREG